MSDNNNFNKYNKYLTEQDKNSYNSDNENKTELSKIPLAEKPKRRLKPGVTFISILIIAALVLFSYNYLKGKIQLPFDKAPSQSSSDKSGSSGQVSSTVRITFPEGYTVYQIGKKLEENGVCKAADFYKEANKPQEGLEIPEDEKRVFLLEGYLFPDTYDFYLNENPESVIKRFTDNFKNKLNSEIAQLPEDSEFTFDEILTLASIIQKECDEDILECRNVSSVFHNRLSDSKNSYLGSDVTYFYLKNMADYLGGADSAEFDDFLLKYYTYNGYRKGLPTGPICNPSIKAISAAIEPAKTDYRFFLTDKSGKDFYYAVTYEEHLANAEKAGLQ